MHRTIRVRAATVLLICYYCCAQASSSSSAVRTHPVVATKQQHQLSAIDQDDALPWSRRCRRERRGSGEGEIGFGVSPKFGFGQILEEKRNLVGGGGGGGDGAFAFPTSARNTGTPTGHRRRTGAATYHLNDKRRRRSSLTRRSLFSFNMNNNGSPKEDGESSSSSVEEKKDKEDIPAWVRALRRWPLYPSLPQLSMMPPPSVEEEREALADQKTLVALSGDDQEEAAGDNSSSGGGAREGRLQIPLASLINVEALLLASGEDILDNVSDPMSLERLIEVGGTVDTNGKAGVSRNEENDGVGAGVVQRPTNEERSDDAKATNNATTTSAAATALGTPLSILPVLEEQGTWDKLVRNLQQRVFQDVADGAAPPSNGAAASSSPFLVTTPSSAGDSGSSSSSSSGATNASMTTAGSAAEGDNGGDVSVATAEAILKEASTRFETFLNDASSAIAPNAVQDLIVRASKTLALEESAGGFTAAAYQIVKAAEDLARDRGWDVQEAAERARATTQYTADLVALSNGLLVSGYVAGDGFGTGPLIKDAAKSDDGDIPVTSKPLFHDFKSVQQIEDVDFGPTVVKGSEMAALSGGIYQETIPTCDNLGHAIVANGTTANIAWLVTDSIAYEDDFRDNANDDAISTPLLVRTITLRGFDASDENVDRELLLNQVCTASPVAIQPGVMVHSGLLSIAKELYQQLTKYIDLTAPSHKIVLNGHSIGGSLSILMLMLLTIDRGAEYIKEKILRVFTFGSPPVSIAKPLASQRIKKPFMSGRSSRGNEESQAKILNTSNKKVECSILEAFGLPSSLVFGYNQPWDPIIRLFSEIDACYPLLGDLGEDGVTLYASGPSRTLRPITRAIIESWEGWPAFRDTFRNTADQKYVSVGVQYLLLPEPIRYLTDRLVSVNVAVPDVDAIVRVSSKELLPALKKTFPLDVFSISYVPAAVRSFVHHFYPAYGFPFVAFAAREQANDDRQPDANKFTDQGINGDESVQNEWQ